MPADARSDCMDRSLDALAKSLAGEISRRESLRRVGGLLGGGALAYFGIGCAPDADPVAPNRVRPIAPERRRRARGADSLLSLGIICCAGEPGGGCRLGVVGRPVRAPPHEHVPRCRRYPTDDLRVRLHGGSGPMSPPVRRSCDGRRQRLRYVGHVQGVCAGTRGQLQGQPPIENWHSHRFAGWLDRSAHDQGDCRLLVRHRMEQVASQQGVPRWRRWNRLVHDRRGRSARGGVRPQRCLGLLDLGLVPLGLHGNRGRCPGERDHDVDHRPSVVRVLAQHHVRDVDAHDAHPGHAVRQHGVDTWRRRHDQRHGRRQPRVRVARDRPDYAGSDGLGGGEPAAADSM